LPNLNNVHDTTIGDCDHGVEMGHEPSIGNTEHPHDQSLRAANFFGRVRIINDGACALVNLFTSAVAPNLGKL
jgi:hypothetical protein